MENRPDYAASRINQLRKSSVRRAIFYTANHLCCDAAQTSRACEEMQLSGQQLHLVSGPATKHVGPWRDAASALRQF